MKIITLYSLWVAAKAQIYNDDWPVDIKGVSQLFKVSFLFVSENCFQPKNWRLSLNKKPKNLTIIYGFQSKGLGLGI